MRCSFGRAAPLSITLSRVVSPFFSAALSQQTTESSSEIQNPPWKVRGTICHNVSCPVKQHFPSTFSIFLSLFSFIYYSEFLFLPMRVRVGSHDRSTSTTRACARESAFLRARSCVNNYRAGRSESPAARCTILQRPAVSLSGSHASRSKRRKGEYAPLVVVHEHSSITSIVCCGRGYANTNLSGRHFNGEATETIGQRE